MKLKNRQATSLHMEQFLKITKTLSYHKVMNNFALINQTTMTMKKTLLAILCVAAMLSCSDGKSKQNDQKCQKGMCTEHQEHKEKCEKNKKCIILDTKSFCEKVADINIAEWKYLGDKPAIVDFYADWCGPCQRQAPILEEVAKKYEGQIYVYKVNTDESQDVASAFVDQGIPTLLFIPMTGEPAINVGLMSQEKVEKAVEDILLK